MPFDTMRAFLGITFHQNFEFSKLQKGSDFSKKNFKTKVEKNMFRKKYFLIRILQHISQLRNFEKKIKDFAKERIFSLKKNRIFVRFEKSSTLVAFEGKFV